MHSTVKIKHATNTGKLNHITTLLPHWQHALHAYTTRHQQDHQQSNPIPKHAKTKATDIWFNTELTARQLKSVHTQAYKAWTSYTGTLEREIRSKITHSTLEPQRKTVLYRINKQHAWYIKNLQLDWILNTATGELTPPTPTQRKDPQITTIWLPVDPEDLKLARNLVKHAITQPPRLNKVRTMEMDAIICERQDNKHSSYGQWLRVSTLERGKPSYVPLLLNPYFDTLPGEIASLVQVSVSEDNEVSFSLIKEAENAAMREGDNPVYIDANASDNLFASADGTLYGGKFMRWLREMDGRIIARQKWLQARGIPLKRDKQYNNLIKRVREYAKNEINRIVNKLIADVSVTEIVHEKLDFSAPGLSAGVNRLLGRIGRGAFSAKVERVVESHGVRASAFNPAYSSQQCSRCGYVDRGNRVSRDSFECKCCSLRLHADVQAARVLEARRSSSLGGNADPFARVSVGNVRARLVAAHGGCQWRACSLNRVAGTDDCGGVASVIVSRSSA